VLIFAAGLAAGLSRGGTPDAAAPREAVRASAAQAAPAGVVVPVAAPPAAAAVTAHDLSVVEQRLRAEMAQVRPAAAPLSQADSAVLQQVRALIAESEQRQRNDLIVRLAQAVRTVEKQRQVDMNQVQWTMGQLQELTGAAVRDQGTKVDYLLKTASLRR
jgi:hypothetical protein